MRQSREPTPTAKLRVLLAIQRQLSSIETKLRWIGEPDTSAIVSKAEIEIQDRITLLRELIAGRRDRVRRVRGAIPLGSATKVKRVASKLAAMLGGS